MGGYPPWEGWHRRSISLRMSPNENPEAYLTESDKTETEAKSASKASSKNSGDSGATKYSIERLLQDAQPLTGYPRHILAGALYGKTGDLTAEQAKSAAEKFLSTEVKEG